MRKPDGIKPEFCLEAWRGGGIVPADLVCQSICFSVNLLTYFFRDFLWPGGSNSESKPVDFWKTPEHQAVIHVLIGAPHTPARRRGDADALFMKHALVGPMYHPAGSVVVEKGHHLAGGVKHVDGACQNDQVCPIHCICKLLQFPIVGAMGQFGPKTGPTANTGFVKIPGQEEFCNFSAHLFSKLPRHKVCAAFVILTADDDDIHVCCPPPVFVPPFFK